MMRPLHQALCLCASLCLLPPAVAVEIRTGIDPEAQLPYWEVHSPDMSVRLVQRLPDQTRAFFQARGFSNAHAELIAQSCVFQTVFKNTSNLTTPAALEYNLHDWTVHDNGTSRKMKMREHWKQEWQEREVPLAAQLAFEWALYPTQQVYQPGDYNWGMSVFNLKPGRVFDLDVVWQQFGKTTSATITGIQCAPDVVLTPQGPE
ncbi:MAG: hypothetical protein R6X06_01515 [Gammaproteobacteria bacterium]